MEVLEQPVAVIECLWPQCSDRLAVPIKVGFDPEPNQNDGFSRYQMKVDPDLSAVYEHFLRKHPYAITPQK